MAGEMRERRSKLQQKKPGQEFQMPGEPQQEREKGSSPSECRYHPCPGPQQIADLNSHGQRAKFANANKESHGHLPKLVWLWGFFHIFQSFKENSVVP